MRILIIRHGDPDYEHDSLTEEGWHQAELAAERLAKEKIDAFYVSPLGRARDTASVTLKKLGRTAEVKDWLREFSPQVKRPHLEDEKPCTWDWLPEDWTKEEIFRTDRWYEEEHMKAAHVKEAYEEVCQGLDDLLAEYGYRRKGRYYTCDKGNHQTICLFCHFGVEGVMLSHLLNIPPMMLWQGMIALPISLTSLYTEERRKGIVSWRMNAFGSTEHLYAHGEEPSFAGRFCECFEDDTRH
jgi:probable phosphoglycerate mutase